MSADLYLLLSLSVVGIADIWCERISGTGLIGHAQDWLDAQLRKRRVNDKETV